MELLLGQRSPVPDVIAYYIAKRALANQASHKGIRLLVEKLFTGLESGEITCNAAVSACQMAKQSGKALVLHLDAADKLDVNMDHVQFSQQCMGEGQTACKAMELLAELQQKGLPPGVITCNAASVLVRRPGSYYKQRGLWMYTKA